MKKGRSRIIVSQETVSLIPEDKIADIRNRLDIVSVVAERVPLRKAGVSYVGLCPFHTEKTPSFQVNGVKQFYYCFGCQKSGDVFRFLMELDGRSFGEVVKELAARAGVEIEEQTNKIVTRKDPTEKTKLLFIHKQAASWFESQLHVHPEVIAYLRQRGIDEQTERRYRLGYAPASWGGLIEHLQEKRVPLEWMEKAGLVVRKEKGTASFKQKTEFYDKFRNRVMFPVQNITGEIIAFGGRILPSEETEKSAKYMNSPESSLYKKGENLYGLFVAKDAIRQQNEAILVEGNFDVLSLHQHGIRNVVAPMGTALTEAQIRLLKRLVGEEGRVVLMLDGDRAGKTALLKDIWLFHEQNLQDVLHFSKQQVDVRVVALPDGEDPDTYASQHPEDLKQRIQQAQPAVDYAMNQAIAKGQGNSIAEKAKVVEAMAPLLGGVKNPAALDMYVAKLSTQLDVSPDVVLRHIQRKKNVSLLPANSKKENRLGRSLMSFDASLKSLLSLCGDHPSLIAHIPSQVIDQLGHPVLSELLQEVQHQIQETKQEDASFLIQLAPPEMKNEVASAVFAGTFTKVADPKRALDGLCHTLHIRYLRRELLELKRTLAEALNQKDQVRVADLSVRIQTILTQTTKFMDETG